MLRPALPLSLDLSLIHISGPDGRAGVGVVEVRHLQLRLGDIYTLSAADGADVVGIPSVALGPGGLTSVDVTALGAGGPQLAVG